jgi:hypothetical protein
MMRVPKSTLAVLYVLIRGVIGEAVFIALLTATGIYGLSSLLSWETTNVKEKKMSAKFADSRDLTWSRQTVMSDQVWEPCCRNIGRARQEEAGDRAGRKQHVPVPVRESYLCRAVRPTS